MTLLQRATAVAMGGRAILIEGSPGCGKSSLALALIDRGAVLIGDDGVSLTRQGERLLASPPPNIAGLLEVRNLGLLTFPVASDVPAALVLRFDPASPRFIERADRTTIAGCSLPLILIWPDGSNAALKAELAMQHYGLN